MKWALVSEWLVEDPWQFVRGREGDRWNGETEVGFQRAKRRRPDVAGGLCGSRTGTFSFPFEGFWVELSSGLQRARQFVKAFSERGGDLHTAQSQHREMIFVSPHQPEHKNMTNI